jgi:SAM-dependent methyltransferase|uniref:Polyketide synthase-like methyltransferase domain-containing protein n=1 Tax=Eutreptiella gymnastica TaxID=73025 RepID=A0A7S4FT39_9EUGL
MSTDDAAKSLARTWDIANKVVWCPAALPRGLSDLLQLEGGERPLRILDCACGSGFPGVELRGMGLDVSLCDGSEDMTDMAKAKAVNHLGRDHGMDIRTCTWDQLPEVWGKEVFDVVLWRGNSMPYVCDAWTNPSASVANETREAYSRLVESAKAVYDVLVPGGRLYCDCIGEVSETFVWDGVVHKHGIFEGKKVDIEWTFSMNEAKGTRTWASVSRLGEEPDQEVVASSVTGVLVREQEVRAILTYAGFGFIDKTQCKGESTYQAFVVQKPSVDLGFYCRQNDRLRRVWNSNGRLCWGLFPGQHPVADVLELDCRIGSGALVGPHAALDEFLCSRLPGTAQSVVDVGCGTGRSAINLARRLPHAHIRGCDPSAVNITVAEGMAQAEGVGGRVSFFTGTAQEMLGTDCHGMMFDAAWSEAALCHAPPADRRAALAAIFSQLKPGGVLILHDAVQGPSPISPTAQLHVYERLQLSGLWTAPQYMETLTSLGFSVQEYINLTSHQAASYSALSITARAVSHDCEADEESQQAFQQMAHDYKISGMMAAKHQLGWGLFIATKSDIGAAATA